MVNADLVLNNPFPADHFKINNKSDNQNMLILFSAYYLGKQIKESDLCKIFEFITNHHQYEWNLFTPKTICKKKY